MTDQNYEQPEDALPVTSSPSSVVDPWGDPRFLDVDDPAQADLAASIGPALATTLTHGLVNADWRRGPPDPGAPIGDENPLPDWTFVSEQGSIGAEWVASTSSKSGYAIRWTAQDTALNDRAYLEQIAEVAPGDSWVHFRAYLDADVTVRGSLTGLYSFASVQFYDAAGVATGGEVIVSADLGSSGIVTLGFSNASDFAGGFAAIPSDARYVAFRQGLRDIVGGAAGAAYRDTLEVYFRKPDVIYATFATSLATTAVTGTGNTAIYAVSAGSDGTPAVATERFVPFRTGYVVGIGARLSTPRTAGTLTFQAINDATAQLVGPTAVINGTSTQEAAGFAAVGTDQAWHFEGGIDYLRVRATGASFTPTAADALVHVTVAMFDLD